MLSAPRLIVYRWVAQPMVRAETCLGVCLSGRPAYTGDKALREALLELVTQPPNVSVQA